MQSVTAKDIVEIKPFELVMVQASDSISDVLEKLAQNFIQSAPVIDQNGIIGFIDVLDLVSFACSIVGMERTKPLDHVMKKFMEEFNKPVLEIMNISMRDRWMDIPSMRNLQDFVKQLAKPNVHRVTVSDETGHIGIITQSSLLQFLYENRASLGERIKLRVADLWPESKHIATIRYDESVIRAFRDITRDHISGLAVVNNEGKLVGNISASDIKHAGLSQYFGHIPSLVYDLSLPISSFLNLLKPDNPFGKNKIPDFLHVSVKKEDTLERVMEILCSTYRTSSFAKTHIHRVYVVDEEGKPIRAITNGDVIAQLEY